MAEPTWKDVAAAYAGSWPGRLTPEDFALMVQELEARLLSPAEVLGVVRSSTAEHPLGAAALTREVEVVRQGLPPAFREAHAILASHITKLDYHDPEKRWPEFIAAVSMEHEAVGRYALSFGSGRAMRNAPDPRFAQTKGGAYELSRLEREYAATTEAWRADPTRGVALEEARRTAAVTSGGSMASVVDGLRPAAELPSGA